MGFEQLAELRDRLRAEKVQVKTDSTKQRPRKPSPQTKPREQDPALEAIWGLQKQFPLAFPVNPAPKVPLKEGILKDAEQHLELLGISSDQLKQGIAMWCRGSRYWTSMTENAPRLDLNGQAVGIVTAAQALHAKQQAKRQRGQARRNQKKPKEQIQDKAVHSTVEQIVDLKHSRLALLPDH
ncbi:ProQ/FinO family protein [Pseudomonas sp. SST3]|jgi:ProP effector|uniref:ProQ/FinO family protein n=1 Tax=Pseudomonas sp. SST3 TaxID=2267882 RepID=UPI000DFB15E7|nr:ProQ/FinO family protein [Pseudomonas sp. SST3]NKQ12737.1 ProQ activator of osmoprotectant transporter prop [Pseudomonas sp. SST3]